jgi:diguanylate cyclase (GGDEF)-like protein
MKEYGKAVDSFKQAAIIAKRIRANRVLIEIYKDISEASRELKDYQQALEYYEQFHKLKEAAQQEKENQEKRYRKVIDQAKVARREADLLQIKNDQLENEINERILLQQKLEILAKTDSLTGLLNRRAFFTQASLAYERAIRGKEYFAIVLFDIDLFKQINDTYGHQIGDQVLSKIGQRLQRNAREEDLVCRFGGEEFIILLQGIDLSDGDQFAKELRKVINRPILAQDQSYNITASFGVSAFDPAHPVNIDKLIEMADKAMYRSKELGRDRVTLSQGRRNTRSLKLAGFGLQSIFSSKDSE